MARTAKKAKSEAALEGVAYYEALRCPRDRVLAAGGRFLRNYGPAELYVVKTAGDDVPKCLLLVPIGFPDGRNPIGWDVYESVAPETGDIEETLAAAGLPVTDELAGSGASKTPLARR